MTVIQMGFVLYGMDTSNYVGSAMGESLNAIGEVIASVFTLGRVFIVSSLFSSGISKAYEVIIHDGKISIENLDKLKTVCEVLLQKRVLRE